MGGSKPVLDAGGSSRHIKVAASATFSARNLVFLNGKVADDGGSNDGMGGQFTLKGCRIVDRLRLSAECSG